MGEHLFDMQEVTGSSPVSPPNTLAKHDMTSITAVVAFPGGRHSPVPAQCSSTWRACALRSVPLSVPCSRSEHPGRGRISPELSCSAGFHRTDAAIPVCGTKSHLARFRASIGPLHARRTLVRTLSSLGPGRARRPSSRGKATGAGDRAVDNDWSRSASSSWPRTAPFTPADVQRQAPGGAAALGPIRIKVKSCDGASCRRILKGGCGLERGTEAGT
jgi:hypothetical protein